MLFVIYYNQSSTYHFILRRSIMLDVLGFLCCGVFLLTLFLAVFFTIFRFTIVEEGTGRLVLKMGAYHKTLLAKVGFTTDDDGKVVGGEETHLLGGLRFVGIRGIHSIFEKDKFRWVKSKPGAKQDETLEEKRDTNVSRLLVRYYTYGIVVRNNEDKNLVPITVWLAITAWINNPKKAWLDTEDWFSTFAGRIEPYVRDYVSRYEYEEIIKSPDRRLDLEVFQRLKDEGIIGELANLHGVEIHAIECADISPEEEYRKSTLKKWEASKEMESRLGSTVGTVMEMLAKETGMSIAELQQEIKADPAGAVAKYEGFLKMNKEFVALQMGLQSDAVKMHEFKGGQGGLDLIALLGDVFGGGAKKGP